MGALSLKILKTIGLQTESETSRGAWSSTAGAEENSTPCSGVVYQSWNTRPLSCHAGLLQRGEFHPLSRLGRTVAHKIWDSSRKGLKATGTFQPAHSLCSTCMDKWWVLVFKSSKSFVKKIRAWRFNFSQWANTGCVHHINVTYSLQVMIHKLYAGPTCSGLNFTSNIKIKSKISLCRIHNCPPKISSMANDGKGLSQSRGGGEGGAGGERPWHTRFPSVTNPMNCCYYKSCNSQDQLN